MEPKKLKRVRDVTTPLTETACRRWLGITTVDLCTKFEIAMFIHCEDMKGSSKCRNWCGFGVLGVTQGHRQHDHLIEHV